MILITGATGFLGQRVVKTLLELKKEPLRCFVRNGTRDDYFESITSEAGGGDLELFKGSFSNIKDFEKALKGVDSVIHLAALKSGSVPVQVANNVVGSENLFISVKYSNINRFVLCSSLGVVKASQVNKQEIIDETCPIDDQPHKRDPYSYSKIIQEKLAWDYYKNEKLPLVVIRPGVIFGPPESILSPRIGLNLFGMFFHFGGRNILPFTYKDNCAHAIALANYQSDIEGEIFHITDDNLPKSNEVLKMYKKNIKSIRAIPVPYMALKQIARLNKWYSSKTYGHLPDIFTPYKVDTMWKGHKYSNEKAKNKLGWQPMIPMQKALEMTIKYESEQNK